MMRSSSYLVVALSLLLAACGSDSESPHGGTGGSGVGGTSAGGTGGTNSGGAGGTSGAGTGGTGGSVPPGVPWAGILDPLRAIDWSEAGVVGGIPNRTTVCATLNPGATAADINAAIQACPDGQVVSLTAGTYDISDDGIVMKSGVTVRGAGADQTLLVFTAVNPCGGGWSSICFIGTNEWGGDPRALPGGSNAADWTAGYARGSTEITLANVGSAGIAVGQYLYLDQANDTQPGPDFFVCDDTAASCSMEGGNGPRQINGTLRAQVQIVKVTAINGDKYTITPGLYAPNWRASQSPGAWWASETIQNAGIEDVSIDSSNDGGQANIAMYNATNDWVRGVRLLRTCQCERDLVQLQAAAHCTIESNYLYGTQGHSVNYGIEQYGTVSDNLVQNNILQHVVAPLMIAPATGSVVAFNYAINDTYDDGNGLHWMLAEIAQHNGGAEYDLYEGNVGPGFGADAFHGNQLVNTLFRNYFLGSDPGRTDATTAISLQAYNRYHNFIGNVLGTPGYTVNYEGTGIGPSQTVYQMGTGDTEGSVTVPDDPLVKSTSMRWGNWDVATGTAHFDASEVPSGVDPYGNAVPASQTLPASFFSSSQPSFWPSAKPWPAIGPEVSGGNISGLDGHASTIPAEDCYLNTMQGPADGSGTPLSFNRAQCYP